MLPMCLVAAASAFLLLPLSVQALEVISVSRGARLVDPGNNFYVFDQRNTTAGVFEARANSRGLNWIEHFSYIETTPGSIVLALSSFESQRRAILDVAVGSSQAISESWLRMGFRASGPSLSTATSFTFGDVIGASTSPTSFRSSLRDVTAGTTLFDLATADFGPSFGPSFTRHESLIADHVYEFDWTLIVADASSSLRRASNGLDFSIVAQPVPEPGTAALMLVGLGLAAGVARRRRSSRPAKGGRFATESGQPLPLGHCALRAATAVED